MEYNTSQRIKYDKYNINMASYLANEYSYKLLEVVLFKSYTTARGKGHWTLIYKKGRLEQSLLAWSSYFPSDLGLILCSWTVIHYSKGIGNKKVIMNDKYNGKNAFMANPE